MCRICERHIPASQLEAHTPLCEKLNDLIDRNRVVDELLLKHFSVMERRVQNALIQRPGQDQIAAKVDHDGSTALLHAIRSALSSWSDVADHHEYAARLVAELQPVLSLSDFYRRIGEAVARAITEKADLLSRQDALLSQHQDVFPEEPRDVSSTGSGGGSMNLREFTIVKTISRGAFGHVYLAKKQSTGEYFAIKTLRKQDIIRKNQVKYILSERESLTMLNSPFVTKLYYCFQSVEYLYMVMEYCNGGDIYSLLRSMGTLDENWTRFYAAEITLALEHIHGLGIVHRDLKVSCERQ
jgi:hypothetical protein